MSMSGQRDRGKDPEMIFDPRAEEASRLEEAMEKYEEQYQNWREAMAEEGIPVAMLTREAYNAELEERAEGV